MHPFNRVLFLLAHEAMKPGFYSLYSRMLQNQWKPYSQIKDKQETELRRMIHYCYRHIPFYKKHFKMANVHPNDIRNVEDLVLIPPITKDDLRKNKDAFFPARDCQRYYTRDTGGTTGTPLRYRISHNDRFLGATLLYRGWAAAGYRLGDPMLFLAGASLMPEVETSIRKRLNEITRNIKFYSAFDMDKRRLQACAEALTSWKPDFLRGYPSALNEFASYMAETGREIPRIKGVFTTSEKLFPRVRENLEGIFDCKVFDGYGANDGGVSTFECERGGIHIDMERSILEVVDEENQQIDEGEGEVLATSLHNYAMPFIRYKIGDRVVNTSETCGCGRGLPILKEIVGRTVSVFVTPNGSRIHGWFFLYIFWDIGEEVDKYKVTQKARDLVQIDIVPGHNFSDQTIARIRELIEHKCSDWTITIRVVDSIPKPPSGKTIYIESEIY